MRKIVLALALASASLGACTPPSSAGAIAAKADADLTRVENAYLSAKAFAAILLPLLPADRAAQIVAAEQAADVALAAARAAVTVAERATALKQVKAATEQLDAVSVTV
jgi:HJR/Mrr/RecB family endonuclease